MFSENIHDNLQNVHNVAREPSLHHFLVPVCTRWYTKYNGANKITTKSRNVGLWMLRLYDRNYVYTSLINQRCNTHNNLGHIQFQYSPTLQTSVVISTAIFPPCTACDQENTRE